MVSDESALESALHNFRQDCGRYPTEDEGLQALREAPPGLEHKWKGPYLDHDVPLDPWDHPYVYLRPGAGGPKTFTIISYGPSGQPGSDDIVETGSAMVKGLEP